MDWNRHVVRLSWLALLLIPLPAAAQWVANGTAVSTGPIAPRRPVAVSDGAGGTIVVWHQNVIAGADDIYAQRLNAAGVPQWSPNGVPVCTAAGDQTSPVAAPDGAGGVIIAWEDARALSPFAGLYAQRLNAAGTPLWTANGAKLSSGSSALLAGSLGIAADGAGGALLGWSFSLSIGVTGQRVNSAGLLQWGPAGVVVNSTGSSIRVRVVSDQAGGAIMAWQDQRSGNANVYARHLSAGGGSMGPPNGTPLCTHSSAQTFIEIASDDSGGAIVTWQDSRVSPSGIYASRFKVNNQTPWTSDGVMISDTTNAQILPRIVPNGDSGAIIAWADQRRGSNLWDIYAQGVSRYGEILWDPHGRLVKLATAPSLLLPDTVALVPDGVGGAIVVWEDATSNAGDIYAQRINGSGDTLWMASGVPVCAFGSAQKSARVVPDGAHGAIVAWLDGRAGNDDLYAQHVTASGETDSAPDSGWASGCNAVCTADSAQTIPLTVPDGAGGAFIVWGDRRDSGLLRIYGQRVDANGAHQWTDHGILIRGGSYANPGGAAPDGEGGVIVVWYDGASDIYAQHVTANGTLLWPAQGVAVCTATGSQSEPRIATDGSGGAIITWHDDRAGGPGNTDIYAQRVSRAGAPLWTANGVSLSTASGGQTQPEIVATGDGGAIVTWIDFGGASPDIYAQKVNAAGSTAWTANGVPLCTAARGQVAPNIVSDGAKGAIVVWQDDRVTDDVYAQRVDSTGVASWTANGVAIAVAANSQLDPQIASDGTGGAIISWYDGRGATYDIYAQRVSRTGVPQWTVNGVPVCGATGHQGSSRVCSDGSGGAIVAWTDPRSGTHAIYAQRVNSAGSALWTANGVGFCPGSDTQLGPALAPDGLGGVIAAWTDYRDAAQVGDIYAHRIGPDGTLGPAPPVAWDPGGSPVCDVPGIQLNPAMAPDAQGGAIFAWEDYRDSTAAHVRGGGGNVVLGPGGARVRTVKFDESGNPATGWTAGGQRLSLTESNQLEPAAVSDGQGGAIMVWKDDRNGGFDLYASRVTAAGTTAAGWPATGLAICTATGEQNRPRVTPDQLGGAIITWTDARNGATDIFAQRVSGAGAVQWTANGIALCTAANAQQDPAIVFDGAGGAIIAWTDTRGAAADIYAQRVNGAGVAQWTANGIALCAATAAQQRPSMAPDAAGGAILAWEDARSGNFDVYGQRVQAAGGALWAPDGIVLCSLTGDQKAPSVVVDGTGGAILSWQDGRGGLGNADIYAQRVVDSGAVQWAANGVVLCSATGDQQFPATVYDNLGGAIVTWQDARAGGTDIYAARVLSSGTLDPRYAANGIAVCTATGTQSAPLIVPDGTGGAIVGWTDARAADSDIYAYHLLPPTSQSVTDVASPRIVAASRLGALYPNPSWSRATTLLELAVPQAVSADVLDVAGRRVRGLFQRRWLAAGSHRIAWDGRNDAGVAVEPGVYFVRVRTSGRTEARPVAMIR